MTDTGDEASRRVIVIGAGEGGTQVILNLFRRLKPCNDPILIVQRHMPPGFTEYLAALIARATGRSCREAIEGEEIRHGIVRIAPAGKHMRIVLRGKQRFLSLQAGEKINGGIPSLDPTLESAAENCPFVLAAILCGKGRDGCDGARAVRAAGGCVLVLEEPGALSPEMPRNVMRLTIGANTLSLDGIADAIANLQPQGMAMPVALGRREESVSGTQLVAIGSSTGGPAALLEFFDALPATFAQPIVIAQHIPAGFPKRLAQSIGDATGWRIDEAGSTQKLTRGTVLIAPGNRHLRIISRDGVPLAILDDSEPRGGNRPSVDILFSSAAREFGDRAIALVLSGMGNDGLAGSRDIVKAGGVVFAQDRLSSSIWGMPGAVAQAGLAKTLRTPQGLAAFLAEFSAARTEGGHATSRADCVSKAPARAAEVLA